MTALPAIPEGLGTGQIADAMDELGLPVNAGGGYRLLGGKGGAVFGRAFTLRQVPVAPGQPGTIRQAEAATTLARPGDILVIDAGGRLDAVTWGEGHSLRARGNGLAGVLLHGATRDAQAIAAGPLPVLCRGTSPLRSKGRMHTAAIGEVVYLDGIRIAPGDLLAMDADGIVALSPGVEAQVLARAAEILATEQARDTALFARLRGI